MSPDNQDLPRTEMPQSGEAEFTGPRIRSRLKPVGRVALKAARQSLKQNGPGDMALVEAWPDIAGPRLAPFTFPLSLNRRSRILTVRVSAGRALEVQHLEPQIIERIATYCGSAIAERLKIVQGPLPRRPKRPTAPIERPLTDAERQHIAAAVEGIHEPRLKSALTSLGERLTAKSPAK